MDPILDANRLRSRYLRFFEARGHTRIPSSPLIPENDPSALFTSAGMHPLVPYLCGQSHPAGTRLVGFQKCLRTTDIEEVGDDTHLTLFEMLGNWSLGDYDREDSITWSFEFLTGTDGLGLPVERLFVTVFAGNSQAPRDERSAALWRGLGIPSDQIAFLGEADNWWSTGTDGPCGPDTEIFFDTRAAACGDTCRPGSCAPKCERFVEIWNNVFMCFERRGDQTHALSDHNVDTGMGVERTVAALNGCRSVYETPELRLLVDAIASRLATPLAELEADTDLRRALRITVDHLRSAVFVLGDPRAVTPSNQGAGYVLRRLIRRALRFCETLALDPEDWREAAGTVIECYSNTYPELSAHADRIHEELRLECERFERVREKGMRILERALDSGLRDGERRLPGDVAFRLYDTYGFPIEFTREIAGERGFEVDLEAYDLAFARHRERSRQRSAGGGLADDDEQSVRYHTATHLLHAALREVLGDHVEQRGSNITKERLRFDFSHPEALSERELAEVVARVQAAIDSGYPVTREVTTLETAREQGALGLFGDRYESDVSIYRIGDVSLEICGGPHVANTREIGLFRILKEKSSSAGVRRIRAVIQPYPE